MKIITNKFVISLFLINLLYIIVGYFGILDTTGYLGVINYYDGIQNGTPAEYWKVKLSYYYSITYLMLPVLNIITILLYKGSDDLTKKIALALKIQIVAFFYISLILNLSKLNIEIYYTEYSLELLPIIKDGLLKYYDFFILIASIMFVIRKDIKNIKLIGVLLLSSLIVLGFTKLHANIHRSDMVNKVIEAQSRYMPSGTSLIKLKPNIFSIEIMPDGVVSFERVTNNYKSLMHMVAYILTNKPSNKETFELAEKIYTDYKPKDETYIKEKLGELYPSTMLYNYNMINKFKENDLYLLEIYKKKGLDAAMVELNSLNENKKYSLIGMFINISNNQNEMN